MPAIVPQFLATRDNIARIGIVDESFLWVNKVTTHADRQKIEINDEDNGQNIYAAYIFPEISWEFDAVLRGWAGLGNTHPGMSVNVGDVDNISDTSFGFNAAQGKLIYESPTRNALAGRLHEINFTLRLIFPEGVSAGATGGTSTLPSDPDGSGESIVIEEPVTGGSAIDPETGAESLQVVRFFYNFVPALGATESGDTVSAWVTRIVSSATAPTLDSLYATGNPPGASWCSPYGPDWTVNDATGYRTTAIPGCWSLTSAYHLNADDLLLGSETEDLYDSASHGTDVVVAKYNAASGGAQHLMVGDFPDQAAVLAYLGISVTDDLDYIWNAVARQFIFLAVNPGTDPLLPWRISTAQPVAAPYLQAFYVFGTRGSPSGSFHFLRVTETNFGLNAYQTDDFPTVPPAAHWNSGSNGGSTDDITAAYCFSSGEYVLGDSSAVAALGLGSFAPSGGPDVWIFRWQDVGHGSASGQWDWIAGTYPDLAAFVAAKGPTSNFAVIYQANAATYHKGSVSWGNPFDNTTGISRF